MLNKKLQALAHTGLMLCLGAAITAPATAEPTDKDSYLLSQLPGYETTQGEPQLSNTNYQIGEIVNVIDSMGVGPNVVTVRIAQEGGETEIIRKYLDEPSAANLRVGDAVLVSQEGEDYDIVGPAQPRWLLTLVEDYNVDPVVGVERDLTSSDPALYEDTGVSSERVEPLPSNSNESVAPLPGTPNEPVAPLPGNADTPASVPPLPEERSEPVAMVMPMDGQVSVMLKNNTNALITYEAVGHTQRRYLQGGEETTLQGLPLPLTLTMVRQDDGFIEVVPVTSESGMLEISLDEETEPLDENQGVVRIQEDGQVFVN